MPYFQPLLLSMRTITTFRTMFFFTLGALLLLPQFSFAQSADAILGLWITESDKSVVEVSKSGGSYIGKIISVRDSIDKETGKPVLDKFNPQEYLRSKPVVGLRILQNLKFDQGEWVEGTIYDPENGKEYSCKARLNGSNLDLRGYILGMPFLGRTTTWRRKN